MLRVPSVSRRMGSGEMTPADIKRLRSDLTENATTFGARFHRSGRTVEDWEQGRRTPDALALERMHGLRKKLDRAKNKS